jgi:hypothetical protein
MLVRRYRIFCIFFTVLLSANGLTSGVDQISSPSILEKTENISFHPAGPTIRYEWRDKSSSVLYRVEIRKLRSGQFILDHVKLIHNPQYGWRLIDASNKTILKISSEDVSDKKNLLFQVENQKWNLTILNEEVPINRSGISTESEYALDIICIRD